MPSSVAPLPPWGPACSRPKGGSMRSVILALCILLTACRTEEAAQDAAYDAGISFVFAAADPMATAAPVDASAAKVDRLAPYASAKPTAAKSIGHTSVVFRVDFDSSIRAAYKPESKRGHKRYR